MGTGDTTLGAEVLAMVKDLVPVVVPKLFEAPFLLAVVLIIFFWWFRRELKAVFSRGDILVSWGDRSIRLRELSKSLDEELDPIRDDVEGLKQDLTRRTERVKVAEPAGPYEPSADRKHAAQRIRTALESSEFTWRSIERLAALSGLSEQQTLEILRADSDVRLSVGKSGRRIAGLKSRVGA